MGWVSSLWDKVFGVRLAPGTQEPVQAVSRSIDGLKNTVFRVEHQLGLGPDCAQQLNSLNTDWGQKADRLINRDLLSQHDQQQIGQLIIESRQACVTVLDKASQCRLRWLTKLDSRYVSFAGSPAFQLTKMTS